jgi:hypothetical protein
MPCAVKVKMPPPVIGPNYYIPYNPYFYIDVCAWCEDEFGPECIGRWSYNEKTMAFDFTNEKDAAYFKLRWGGVVP